MEGDGTQGFQLGTAASWLAILASLGWNFFNHRSAKRLKRAALHFDRFNKLRAPVDEALSELKVISRSMRSLQAHESVDHLQATAFPEIQRNAAEAYDKLVITLGFIDDSHSANGTDWSSTATDDWDDFIDSIDRVYSPHLTRERLNGIVDQSAVKLDSLCSSVTQKLEDEAAKQMKAQ